MMKEHGVELEVCYHRLQARLLPNWLHEREPVTWPWAVPSAIASSAAQESQGSSSSVIPQGED